MLDTCLLGNRPSLFPAFDVIEIEIIAVETPKKNKCSICEWFKPKPKEVARTKETIERKYFKDGKVNEQRSFEVWA